MSSGAKVQLKLYITGRSERSEKAISRAMSLAKTYNCEVEVIDVLEDGRRAQEEAIITTPTLVKASPPPAKRFMGDLSNLKAVRNALNLPKPATKRRET